MENRRRLDSRVTERAKQAVCEGESKWATIRKILLTASHGCFKRSDLCAKSVFSSGSAENAEPLFFFRRRECGRFFGWMCAGMPTDEFEKSGRCKNRASVQPRIRCYFTVVGHDGEELWIAGFADEFFYVVIGCFPPVGVGYLQSFRSDRCFSRTGSIEHNNHLFIPALRESGQSRGKPLLGPRVVFRQDLPEFGHGVEDVMAV